MNKKFSEYLFSAMQVTDNLLRTLNQTTPQYAKAFDVIGEDFLKALKSQGIISDYHKEDRWVFDYDPIAVAVRYPLVRGPNPNINVMGGIQAVAVEYITQFQDRLKDCNFNDPWSMLNERQAFRDILEAWKHFGIFEDYSLEKDAQSVTMKDPKHFLSNRQISKLNEADLEKNVKNNPSM